MDWESLLLLGPCSCSLASIPVYFPEAPGCHPPHLSLPRYNCFMGSTGGSSPWFRDLAGHDSPHNLVCVSPSERHSSSRMGRAVDFMGTCEQNMLKPSRTQAEELFSPSAQSNPQGAGLYKWEVILTPLQHLLMSFYNKVRRQISEQGSQRAAVPP